MIKSIKDIPQNVRNFISPQQAMVLVGSSEHGDILNDLNSVIEKMPKTYETDGQGSKAIAYLHYFKGDSHFFITEKDSETEQFQAFGLAVLNGDWMFAEMGYISIEELKANNVELDLFWTPKTIKEIREESDKYAKGGLLPKEGMFNDSWSNEDINKYIREAKSNKKKSNKDYIVYLEKSDNAIGYMLYDEYKKMPETWQNSYEIIFDTLNINETVKVKPEDRSESIREELGKYLNELENKYGVGFSKKSLTDEEFDKLYDFKLKLNEKLEQGGHMPSEVKNNTENMKKEIFEEGGIINTAEINPDNGNILSDPTIQNASITSQEYVPQSKVCETVETVAPVAMLYDMNKSLSELDRKVRGVDDYVMARLGFDNFISFCKSFSAEQVDAIANAIYQIEKGGALIVGDMTGVGKGRIAAGIIRYAINVGKFPIFFTEKPNLFSDIYRDLIAIGADSGIPLKYKGKDKEVYKKVSRKTIEEAIKEDIENGDFELDYDVNKLFTKEYSKETNACIEEYRDLNFPNELVIESSYYNNEDYKNQIRNAKRIVPFIFNGRSVKSDIKDEDGNIIYQGLTNTKPDYELSTIFKNRMLPEYYNLAILTYSQVNSPKRAVDKVQFLQSIASGAIIVLDESHNASGSSQTGRFLSNLLESSSGVCFLSATFAKRPDNMPIYATKTAIQDAELDSNNLVAAIQSGGVALQEILSSELVSEGQMLRRERSYDGVIVNYNYLDNRMEERDSPLPDFNLKEKHEAISNTVTSIIRRILNFQKEYVNPVIAMLDEDYRLQQAEAGVEKGNIEGGINNTPIFSGIFNLINQLLLSIKADAVADFTIMRMKEGKKPIIGLANTLESFLDYLIEESSSTIKTDFSVILKRRLDKTLEYKVTLPSGETEKHMIDVTMYDNLMSEYYSILEDINNSSTGITISPIDRIITRIREAGFTVAEVTGRKKYVEFLPDGVNGIVKTRKVEGANDLFRKFNDNEVDCLIINQSGATGASAQSIKTKKVYDVKLDENGKPIIPTSLEPRNEVKQRCMVILQAELDINKEVQKRGRINRTGQIFKPIYDYVISAIPAEERLMMMLQKKLKSLDANTTSNQKQSKKVLDVVDFLNIYGDMKVVDFMEENPSYNDMTGNILKFVNGRASEDTKGVDDKAHKVSGRIAILPVDMQSNFYKTVSELYINLEEQLKASGEWNLEVESMDLKALTLDKSAIMVGNPNKTSVFADSVFLERCEVDNLRKPYSQKDVKNILKNALTIINENGESITLSSLDKVEYLRNKLKESLEFRLRDSISFYEEKRKKDIENATNMPSLEKKTPEERELILNEKIEKINSEIDGKINSLKTSTNNLRVGIEANLSFFYTNRILAYPLANYDTEGNYVKGICVGVDVNFKSQGNPFAPSAMSVRILLPNGMKVIKYTLADSFLSRIKDATNNQIGYMSEYQIEHFIDSWDELTKESQANRITRLIVTGNILKAYGNGEIRSSGKLISYTTKDGKISKGILLPDVFKSENIRVSIPVNKLYTFIMSMPDNSILPLDSEIDIHRTGSYFTLNVKKSSSKFFDVVNDEEINSFAFMNKFDLVKGKFPVYKNKFEIPTIKRLIQILWDKHQLSGKITQTAFDAIKDEFTIKETVKEFTEPTEELIKKHNKQLDEYEESQKFELISEPDFDKLSELEKENYELRKRNAELEAIKKLYVVSRLMSEELKKRKREAQLMEQGGGVNTIEINKISDINFSDNYQLVQNSQDLNALFEQFNDKFLTEKRDIDDKPFAELIGGAFLEFTDDGGDINRIFVFEGDIPENNKYLYEIYPSDKYFN